MPLHEQTSTSHCRAVLIEKDDAGYRAVVKVIDLPPLAEGDVRVAVAASCLNYKDSLAITGKAPVVRKFPMVAGIDFAGTVIQSQHPDFAPGDGVILNGWGVGETHWGGLAEQAQVPGSWLVPLPSGMTATTAMAIGTAGYTAMLCLQALERHGVTPASGDIVVTGASGGVGSVAIALLADHGYRVSAVTGRPQEADYLRSLGASEIIERASLAAPGKPLARERWAGAVDTVGSHTLANVCAAMRYRGVVTACGLAGGMDFPATVAPFILRGITLAGIDSVMCPSPERRAAWLGLQQALQSPSFAERLQRMTHTIPLDEAIATATSLLQGQQHGRVVVDLGR